MPKFHHPALLVLETAASLVRALTTPIVLLSHAMARKMEKSLAAFRRLGPMDLDPVVVPMGTRLLLHLSPPLQVCRAGYPLSPTCLLCMPLTLPLCLPASSFTTLASTQAATRSVNSAAVVGVFCELSVYNSGKVIAHKVTKWILTHKMSNYSELDKFY